MKQKLAHLILLAAIAAVGISSVLLLYCILSFFSFHCFPFSVSVSLFIQLFYMYKPVCYVCRRVVKGQGARQKEREKSRVDSFFLRHPTFPRNISIIRRKRGEEGEDQIFPS